MIFRGERQPFRSRCAPLAVSKTVSAVVIPLNPEGMGIGEWVILSFLRIFREWEWEWEWVWAIRKTLAHGRIFFLNRERV